MSATRSASASLRSSAPAPLPGDLVLAGTDALIWNGRRFACAIGSVGIRADKLEGDGATPAGCFALRRVLYRPDRLAPPRTALPVSALNPHDAWCDDPADRLYNQQIRQPYAASFEMLWRTDGLYDLIVVLGHNDAPVVPGRGSAIFLHVATKGYASTAGCIALARPDLLTILEGCDPRASVWVGPPVH
jgi:L,D-peptidoglycan transpeptidase YkuD (ErfK/YbiS/YcfS/YnhG family)